MATALYSFGMPAARRSPSSLDFQCRISAPMRQPEPQHQILNPRANRRGKRRWLVRKGTGWKPLPAIKASARRIYFVPEGQHDSSLARSAWDSVQRENRPVGSGMLGPAKPRGISRGRCVPCFLREAIYFVFEISSPPVESARTPTRIRPTLRDGSLGGAVPGTSCKATIARSLRDKSHSPRASH
jgi:hypothetical protein